jgi:TOBE domain
MSFCDQRFIHASTSGQLTDGCPGHTLSHWRRTEIGAPRAPLEPLTGPTALVMIRPTGVRLTSNGSDERHLSGRVTDVAFRGELVGLRMDPAGCHLFPAEP